MECDNVHLCLACFSVGAYLEPHHWAHPYRIISNCTQPLFAEQWSATEEIKFMHAVFKYGIHQWHLVAHAVGSKSSFKCEQHYYDVYLNSSTAPLPDCETIVAANGAKIFLDHEASDDDALYEPPDASQSSRNLEVSNRSLKKSEGDILAGYLPKRGDFDVEFNDGAEAVMGDLEIGAEDSQEEAELKMRLVDIYNARLDDRAKKKRFLFDRELLDFQKMSSSAYRGSKDEREFVQRLHAFAKLQTPEEQTRMENALIKEWKVLKELCRVKSWIASGITTRAEGELVEKMSKEKPTRRRKPSSALEKPSISRLPVLDVGNLPGVDQLPFVEREICSALRLSPVSFLAFKEVALKAASDDSGTKGQVKIVKFDQAKPHLPPRVVIMSRRDAEALGYRNIPHLRARRRTGSKRTEISTSERWIKNYGRVQQIKLRKNVKVDRWGVGLSGDEREEEEEFFDEPWFIPGLLYEPLSTRECSESYFDKAVPKSEGSITKKASSNDLKPANDVLPDNAEKALVASAKETLILPDRKASDRACNEPQHDTKIHKSEEFVSNGVAPHKSNNTMEEDYVGTTSKGPTTNHTCESSLSLSPRSEQTPPGDDNGKLNTTDPPQKPKQGIQCTSPSTPQFQQDPSQMVLVPMLKDSLMAKKPKKVCDSADKCEGAKDAKDAKGEQPRTPPSTPVSTETQD